MERRDVLAFRQAAAVLPLRLRQRALALPLEEQGLVEELRLRAGRPLSAVLPEGERSLGGGPVSSAELEQLVEIASRASLHTVLPQICQGYLTIEGGHRLGLCGTAVLREGEIHSRRRLSSANLRVARQVKGAAETVLSRLCPAGRLESTLILAPPGLGKTTLLRDLVRLVSEGEGCQPLRVGVADERGELAAMYNGTPQNDLGARTDILDGCPKGPALLMLLRAMNPQVLAADEITAPADAEALAQAAGCGVKLLCTIHGGSLADLRRRPVCRRLMEEGLFRKVVLLQVREGQRVCRVEDLEGALC